MCFSMIFAHVECGAHIVFFLSRGAAPHIYILFEDIEIFVHIILDDIYVRDRFRPGLRRFLHPPPPRKLRQLMWCVEGWRFSVAWVPSHRCGVDVCFSGGGVLASRQVALMRMGARCAHGSWRWFGSQWWGCFVTMLARNTRPARGGQMAHDMGAQRAKTVGFLRGGRRFRYRRAGACIVAPRAIESPRFANQARQKPNASFKTMSFPRGELTCS